MAETLKRLAEAVSGRMAGDPDFLITGIAPFEAAGPTQITFAQGKRLLSQIPSCGAGAVIVPEAFDGDPGSKNLIYVPSPRIAAAKITEILHPATHPPAGVSRHAVIGKGVCLGSEVYIGHNVTIEDGAAIGDGAVIYPNVYIGKDTSIGDSSIIYPNVSILAGSVIGRRVIIHSGTVVGSDGFGFVPDPGGHGKVPQVGRVVIEDDVEIGANNTIDRATFGETRVGRGVKTDNLVHIAHNVHVGEHTIIVAQVGIAGSTRIGKNVIIAGQAGLGGHIEIGDGAVVGPQAGVTRSVPAGRMVSGTPEMPHKRWLRVQRIVADLPELKKKLSSLEKQVQNLQCIRQKSEEDK